MARLFSASAPFLTTFFLAGLATIVAGQAAFSDKGSRELEPPVDVHIPFWPIGLTLTPTSAIVEWRGPPSAHKYTVTIYVIEIEEPIVHLILKNVLKTSITFNDLEPETDYEVFVQSVRVESNGNEIVSEMSNSVKFKTLPGCKGGKIRHACNAHCVPTCRNQGSVCDRRCVPGCICPDNRPFDLKGVCVTKKRCDEIVEEEGAPVIEVLEKPKNLTVYPIKNSKDVIFTWLPVKGADFYTVIITLRDGTVVQVIDDIIIPFVEIKGLTPKVKYRFKVQAKWLRFGVEERSISRMGPIIVHVTDTTISLKWLPDMEAKNYSIILYNEGGVDILGKFKSLSRPQVILQGLDPDTKYEVSVVYELPNFDIESHSEPVKTLASDLKRPDDSLEVTVVSPTTAPPPVVTTKSPYIPTCRERRLAVDAFYENNPKAKTGPEKVSCDANGNYKLTQCNEDVCYCVEKKTGKMRPGSSFDHEEGVKYELNCGKYGQFDIPDIDVTAFALNTTAIKVNWRKQSNIASYIVKVYSAFDSTLIKHLQRTKSTVEIGGLMRGTAVIVTVIGVNSDGWTSTDKVKGDFVALPYLDPPTNVLIEQLPQNRYKISWIGTDSADHYDIEVFEVGNSTPLQKFENYTRTSIIIKVQPKVTYRVRVRATAVVILSRSGSETIVSSNPIDVTRTPTCVVPPLDIIFVIDVSTKASPENYAKSKELFVKLIHGLTPIVSDINSPIGTRVSLVKAYTSTRTVFRYNKFNTESNMIGAIRFVKQTKFNGLYIGKCIHNIWQHFFDGSGKDDQRSNIATAVVTFFGGKSNDAIADAALRLRPVTKVISVGVKGHASTNDMSLASSSRSMRVSIPSYDDINLAYDRVMELLCSLK